MVLEISTNPCHEVPLLLLAGKTLTLLSALVCQDNFIFPEWLVRVKQAQFWKHLNLPFSCEKVVKCKQFYFYSVKITRRPFRSPHILTLLTMFILAHMILKQQQVTHNILYFIMVWYLGVPPFWCGVLLSACCKQVNISVLRASSSTGTFLEGHSQVMLPSLLDIWHIYPTASSVSTPALSLPVDLSTSGIWIYFSSQHLSSHLFLFSFSLSALVL